jgi:hypothetical protein
MATSLLQGLQQEWALVKRHTSEDLFGVQVRHHKSLCMCCRESMYINTNAFLVCT